MKTYSRNMPSARLCFLFVLISILLGALGSAQFPPCHELSLTTTETSSGSCGGAIAGTVGVTHDYSLSCAGNPFSDFLTSTKYCGGGLYFLDCSPEWSNETVQYSPSGNYEYFQATVRDAVSISVFDFVPVCVTGPTHTSGMITCGLTCGSTCSGLPPVCDNSPAYCDNGAWTCGPGSPIIVDLAGDGISLTSAEGGVDFSLSADGIRRKISWTSALSEDAWLALDRNGNGVIDDGTELFGNFSPQAPSSSPNGFIALSIFDKPASGGNGNGWIDAGDSVFSRLRLWQDKSHDGVSEAGELFTLSELRIEAIGLDYKDGKKTDEFGNSFRYRAKVQDIPGAHVGRWAYDVYLVGAGSSALTACRSTVDTMPAARISTAAKPAHIPE